MLYWPLQQHSKLEACIEVWIAFGTGTFMNAFHAVLFQIVTFCENMEHIGQATHLFGPRSNALHCHVLENFENCDLEIYKA